MQRSFQPAMTAIVLSAAMLLACVPASADVLTLNNGATHDLNYAVAEDNVWVTGTTTVNVLTGGSIFDDLRAWDNSTVTVSGGSIWDDLDAWDDSTVNVTGGTIGDDLEAWNDSTVTVSGGTFGGILHARDNSTTNVSGGTIGSYLELYEDSEVTIFGTFDIFGYGDYGVGNWTNGTTLTGTLEDGTPFNNDVHIYDSATVTLAAPVPEPSSLVLGAIGALGLFGYSRRRRQTSAAA